MGTLAEYGMLMMVMAIVLSLMIPNAIEPFQARIADVRNASLAVSNYRLVASLEHTSLWITSGTPRWYFGADPLSYSVYSVTGVRDSDGSKFALSPKAKADNPSLVVPGTTCANFYAPGTTPAGSSTVRVFAVPCETGTYTINISDDYSGICDGGCTVDVQCSGNNACEIYWSKTVGRIIVRESVQFVP